ASTTVLQRTPRPPFRSGRLHDELKARTPCKGRSVRSQSSRDQLLHLRTIQVLCRAKSYAANTTARTGEKRAWILEARAVQKEQRYPARICDDGDYCIGCLFSWTVSDTQCVVVLVHELI